MTGSQGKQGSKNRGKETNCTEHETTAAAAGAAAPGKADTSTAWDRRIRGASCVSFFLGCVWVLLFPLVTLTTGESKPRGTFFDENAMLVHHTSTKLAVADVDWAKPARLAKAYPQQDGVTGAEWVCRVLHGMDLPCYTHSFYERPASRSGLRKSVYTILDPAPGSDGKECMVLTTTQDLSGAAKDMLDQPTFTGLSLSLSVLKYLKDRVGWMSKRIVVLIADEDGHSVDRLFVGVKRFIDDYHTDTLDLLERHTKDSNMTRSIQHCGVMRAALSLEYDQPGEPQVVQLLTSGVNGELPNMDLLNVAVIHHERQGVGIRLDTCSAPLHGDQLACLDAVGQAAAAVDRHVPNKSDAVQGYFDRLFGMLGFMGSAVMGPSGPHAHFLRHSVDALTIRGLGRTGGEPAGTGKRAVSSGSGVSTTAAVVSIIRGVSNLEEELHHSFFSYIMLSKAAFVSIGEYAYALVLLLVPLALQGRRLSALNGDKTLPTAVLVVATFEVFGALLLWIASAWPEPSETALGVYLKVADLAGYLLVLAVYLCSPRQAGRSQRFATWVGPKTVMSCVLGYACSVTALLSWQVAAVLALTHVPLILAVRPFQGKRLSSWCMAFGMIVSSPARWSSVLGWATARASGTSVVLRWLRLYRLSGLLNLPLMCLVSMPAHLTIAFVLLNQRS
ncbi:unnamed protein product [Ectocarpus sp. 13 AM-2016]